MIKIITIIGARPQIIKASAISRAIKNDFNNQITEVIVHTGQHYDQNMSGVFFDELQIPMPHYNLNVGSISHGEQTAKMIIGIEEILLNEKPNYLLVYGDTNSTLAGAIAASKLLIPIVHVEAGLRSYNKTMPEEINRILCDHASTLLFSPTDIGFNNLVKEGFNAKQSNKASASNPYVFISGDVMFDNLLHFNKIAGSQQYLIQKKLEVEPLNYVLATIHRNANTDDTNKLSAIFNAFVEIATKNNIPFVIPLHPRTAKLLASNLHSTVYEKVKKCVLLKIIAPVSYLEMISLQSNSKMIMTDSGGLQKESYFFNKPCIVLRPETEWTELITCGMATIADANEELIINVFEHYLNYKIPQSLQLYGNGNAAQFILAQLIKHN